MTPEESFMNAYPGEINESEQFLTYTKQLCVILDAKYERVDLDKVMKNLCKHLTEMKRNELLK